MKCLSVQQPWAWAIIHGPKRIENRTWRTKHRGPLLIHAGKSRARLGDYGAGEPAQEALAFGAIIGVATLTDCVPVAEVAGQPFAEGPWCWLLDDVFAFDEPVLYRATQMIFAVPDGLLPA